MSLAQSVKNCPERLDCSISQVSSQAEELFVDPTPDLAEGHGMGYSGHLWGTADRGKAVNHGRKFLLIQKYSLASVFAQFPITEFGVVVWGCVDGLAHFAVTLNLCCG